MTAYFLGDFAGFFFSYYQSHGATGFSGGEYARLVSRLFIQSGGNDCCCAERLRSRSLDAYPAPGTLLSGILYHIYCRVYVKP